MGKEHHEPGRGLIQTITLKVNGANQNFGYKGDFFKLVGVKSATLPVKVKFDDQVKTFTYLGEYVRHDKTFSSIEIIPAVADDTVTIDIGFGIVSPITTGPVTVVVPNPLPVVVDNTCSAPVVVDGCPAGVPVHVDMVDVLTTFNQDGLPHVITQLVGGTNFRSYKFLRVLLADPSGGPNWGGSVTITVQDNNGNSSTPQVFAANGKETSFPLTRKTGSDYYYILTGGATYVTFTKTAGNTVIAQYLPLERADLPLLSKKNTGFAVDNAGAGLIAAPGLGKANVIDAIRIWGTADISTGGAAANAHIIPQDGSGNQICETIVFVPGAPITTSPGYGFDDGWLILPNGGYQTADNTNFGSTIDIAIATGDVFVEILYHIVATV